LTLWLCLAFVHSLGTKSFYLELSWSLLIWSGLVFAFTWLLGTWVRVFLFAFKPSFMIFSAGQCIHQGVDWETNFRSAWVSFMCDERLRQELRGLRLFPLSSYIHMCLFILMANRRCHVVLNVLCNMSLGLWMCRCWVRWGDW
jgi:hypothetical protein